MNTLTTKDYLEYIEGIKDNEVKTKLIENVEKQEIRFVLYHKVQNFKNAKK